MSRPPRAAQSPSMAAEPALPVLPPGLPYLLAALGDNGVEMHALAAVVQRFPTIAGRLLALANSAWASPARPVTGLAEACTLLGLRVVRSVSIALSVARPFDPNRCTGFDAVRFWTSAFLTAEAAALLSPHLDRTCDADTLRTAGLLHNLGLLWLADARSQQTGLALQAVAAEADLSLSVALRERVGTDYHEAGGLLGAAWQLPEALTVAMRHCADADYRGPHWRLAAGCGLAVSIAAAPLRDSDRLPGETAASAWPISSAAMERLYLQTAKKRESLHQLAQALFGG